MKTKPRDPELQPQVVEDIGTALGPVRPSSAFRQHLSGHLSLAATRKVTGEPVIETSSLVRQTRIIAAGILGLIATAVAVMLYLWESLRRESPSSATQ